MHGCCLSSKTWETTPDGRRGWYEYFTRKGFDTYMADQVGRARSGFDALQYNKVQAGAAPASSNPRVLIATDKFAWDVFRFGDYASKTPWPDERFPMQTVGVGARFDPDVLQTGYPGYDLDVDCSGAGMRWRELRASCSGRLLA
jgi:hypothetical protein